MENKELLAELTSKAGEGMCKFFYQYLLEQINLGNEVNELMNIEYEPMETFILHRAIVPRKKLSGGLFDLLDQYLINDIEELVYKQERNEIVHHMRDYSDTMAELRHKMRKGYKKCLIKRWIKTHGHFFKYGEKCIQLLNGKYIHYRHFWYVTTPKNIELKFLFMNDKQNGNVKERLREAITTKKYINIEQDALDAYNGLYDYRKKNIEETAIKEVINASRHPSPYLPEGAKMYGVTEIVATYQDVDYGLKTTVRFDYIKECVSSVITIHNHIIN